MKKYSTGLLFLLILMAQSAIAQETDNQKRKSDNNPPKEKYRANTLADYGGRPTGGFLAPTIKLTEVNNQQAVFTGAQLSMVLGHKVNFGLAGYGMISGITTNHLDSHGDRTMLEMGYGGFIVEPVFFDKNVIHFTTPLFVGMGGATLFRDRFWNDEYQYYESDLKADAFFVAEPGVNLEINVARVLRFGIGAGYRFAFDTDLPTLKDHDLGGWSANLSLKIGWF